MADDATNEESSSSLRILRRDNVVGESRQSLSLRGVLVSSQQLLKLMDDSKSLSMGSENWMKHVQQQAGVLSDLREAIEGSPPASIAAMTTQLSTILRATIYNLGEIADDPNGGITATAAVTSRIRQVHRGAAMCLRVLVGKLVARPTSTGSGPSPTNFSSAKPCIVVLLSCLPHQGSSEEGNEKSTLEDPSETWIEVILTLQVLIRACPMVEEDDSSTQPSLDDLIIRLMGCTTHLLTISTNVECQVQAATLIDMLLERFATDKASLWQTLFPGTLAVLYRCLVSCQRQAATVLLVTLECSFLAIIRHLLLVTLRPIQMERTNAGDGANDDLSSAMHLLQNLQLSTSKSNETKTPEFLSKVQEKAVPPLLILLKQSMASRSSQVQSGVIQLARVLLVDTYACWKETPRLIEAALETCLILQNSGTDHNGDDDSSSVASKARSVLKGYKTTGSHDRQVLQAKIRQLTQELPILSQGGKTVDLKMHLRLLLGYLQTLTDASGEGKAPLVASTFPYEPLIQLVEVDLAATSASSHVLLGEIKIRNGDGVSLAASKVPLKRLAFEQSQVLDQVLMAFGKALGPKQGAFVVDTLLADMFEEWHRQNISVSVVQQWTSRIAIARKVFCGTFARPANIGGGEKDERRRQKTLRALCSSILPVLMDPPLTVWRSKQVTLNIQQGMAAIQILSLEFASTMVNHMEPDIVTALISVMIYPAICMVHSGNGHLIRQSAQEVLAGLVVAIGLDSVAELVRKYSGMLFAETLSRIRVGVDGDKLADGDSGTLDAFRVLQWILEECCRVHSLDSMDPMPSLKNLVELFGRLLRRVDHLHLAKRVAEADAIAMAGAYAALFKYFKTEVVLDDDYLLPKQPASWLDLLSVFEKPPLTGFNSNVEKDSPDEDESVCTSAQATSIDSSLKSTVELSSEIMFRLCVLLSYPSLKVRIAACESLSSGFEYLSGVTSHLRGNDKEDSEIRNAVYRQVAKSWPSIKARLSLVTDEVVARQNPISSLLIVGKSQPDRHPGHYAPDNGVCDAGSLRFFLARLYILIASMFECSGDFMADRFVSSVWPVMTKQLEHLLEPARVSKKRAARSMIEEISATAKDDGRGLVMYEGSSRQSWVESERLLALSIFQCLKRVFFSPGSKGTVLIRIHQAVGLVLLPIITNPDDEVADSASRAVEAVLLHDSDILLRPLLELSGNGIPPIPAFLRGVVESGTGETEVEAAESPLQIRCSKLLDFVANLPEQELS